ncbi:MAG: fibronectin type III domain-containing protein [Planctomycetes bacterium]|nr:fibronectin type III domain-containing protein [Planctomycetota bacterium]
MNRRRLSRAASLGLVLACGLVLALAGTPAAQTTPGTVDTSFGGGDGFVSALGSMAFARAMAVDSLGRILAVGDYNGAWVILRFTTDGQLDTTSFGSSGQVGLFGQGLCDRALDVTTQLIGNDEKIVVVGLTGFYADQQFTVVRLNADGSMDSSFGTNGIVQAEISPYGSGSYAVAVQPDGKIVVAGFSFNKDHRAALTVARYNVDGSLDTQTFGTPNSPKDVKRGAPPHKGYIIDDIAAETNDNVYPGAIALQVDGKIVVAGFSGQSGLFQYQSWEGWTVARYTAGGSVDATFGTNGKVIAETLPPWFDRRQAKGVAIQADGKILVSGRGWTSDLSEFDAVVMRYNANGSADDTFGTNGLTRSWLTGEQDHGGPVAMQSDGKILVADKYLSDMAVFRFNQNGTPDTSFGTSHTGLSDLVGASPGSTEFVYSLALDANGGIFVGGSTDGAGLDVAKFHGDAPVTTPPAAPTALMATAASSSQIDLSWTDNASDEQGFKIERSPDGSAWVQIATVAADATSYNDTGLAPSTTYYYRVRAYNAAGDSAYSGPAFATTQQAPPPVDYLAASDIPVAGTVTGSYSDTHAAGGAIEAITEIESGGNPASKRYSYLEHRWSFNDVAQGRSFRVKWTHVPAGDGDSFEFKYSTDGSTFQTFASASWDNGYQIHVFPNPVSGTVYIRVCDTDRTKGHRLLDTISIDHMFIRSE